MKTFLVGVLIFVCFPALARGQGCDGSGNCYIRAGATGSGTGASWTNAFTGFGAGAGNINPAKMMRGVTYWIASGSYGGPTFSTPVSGTSVVTIEGATTASHGPASDWNNSFAGQAVFGETEITTGYWTFNGQTRGSDWQSNYTLKFWNQSDDEGSSITLSTAATNVTLEYVEVEGTGMTGGAFPNNTTADKCDTDNCGVWADNAIYTQVGSDIADNLYVGYSYIHHTGNTTFQMDDGVNSNLTWEYNWISYNHTGQNGQHDQAYSLYASNVTIRYNIFQDISGSGIITTAGVGAPDLQNWAVYGNLFFWDAAYASLDGQYGLATIDNAVLDFLGENLSGYVYFYNNTIAGFYNSVADAPGAPFSTLPISGNSGYSTGTPTVQIYNNLWLGSAYTTNDGAPYCAVVTTAACTEDYDSFYQGGIPSGDFQNPVEAHGQSVTGSSSPFVYSSPATIAGFGLITPDPFLSNPGITLSSPYNMDMLGTTRGSNGIWDRGALQILTTTTATPAFNPIAGIYNTTQSVSISDTTAGAEIYYTTDGTTPTTSSTLYTGPVSVPQSTTINAFATSASLPNSAMVSDVFVLQTGTPALNPTGGIYYSTQSVSMSDATPGAAIYYTTDGTTPTPSSTPYTGPISVPQTTTINAIATSPGLPISAVASDAYVLQTAPPTFRPAPGTYSSTQSVSISDATAGAAIYYTTDGTTPTPSSAPYTGPISVPQTTTINAMATSASLPNSAVVSATYTLRTATPRFSPAGGTYSSAQSVSISDSAAGAAIYYTTDGTTPTASSTPYTGPISVTQTTTIKAVATSASLPISAVASATYALQTATPKFSPAGGTYSSAQSVSISDATAGAAIYYTTDGTTPTTSSTLYTGPVSVTQTTTIKAIATSASLANSPVASATFTLTLQVATPSFTPAGGTYNNSQSVTLADASSGATIYYTTDGTTPTTSSTLYSGPISVTQNTTIKAIATSASLANSLVASATFTLQAATPSFSLAGGTYNSPQSVSISDATAGAAIYYTTDGTTPTTSSTKYSGPISITQSTTVNAMAAATGWTSSGVATAIYTLQAATPSFSLAGGTYNNSQSVALADASSGATIYYTTNGTTPTTSSTKYSGPISITQSTTVNAMAAGAGWSSSAVATAVYTLQAATPSFSLAGGTYNNSQSVVLSDVSFGVAIYYTTNGTTPTTSSTMYSGPISITQSATVKAFAAATGWSSSAVATAAYTLQAAAPSFSPAGGTYSRSQSIALADASSGVTIYYTTNGSTPTTSSARYRGPISVTQTSTINAIATRTGWMNSSVASATYTIK
ncbi:MAG: chitobiase/beta-hexosaminidase C-terminal domain-containing protein [Candidatus Acidiferrales bacterium]